MRPRWKCCLCTSFWWWQCNRKAFHEASKMGMFQNEGPPPQNIFLQILATMDKGWFLRWNESSAPSFDALNCYILKQKLPLIVTKSCCSWVQNLYQFPNVTNSPSSPPGQLCHSEFLPTSQRIIGTCLKFSGPDGTIRVRTLTISGNRPLGPISYVSFEPSTSISLYKSPTCE